MLRSVQSLHRCNILATDGIAGRVRDVIFDDRTWSVLYWVVDTGTLLTRRLILMSREAIGKPDWTLEYLPVILSRQEVIGEASAAPDLPARRQYLNEGLRFPACECLWPPGWYYVPLTMSSLDNESEDAELNCEGKQLNAHVQSSGEIIRSAVHATDGEVGSVEDFLVDVDRWTIRYMILNTTFRTSAGATAVPVRLVSGVNAARKSVFLNASLGVIRYSQGYEITVDAKDEFHVRRQVAARAVHRGAAATEFLAGQTALPSSGGAAKRGQSSQPDVRSVVGEERR